MSRYLAIDIGASSGRHIVGWYEGGRFVTEEVYRFPNGVTEFNGHLIWNLEKLLFNVKKGIEITKEKYPDTISFSIDTWGVDYVLMKNSDELLPCYSYRDNRIANAINEVHEKIPFSTLYRETGSQFQRFNTIYQLYKDKLEGRLDNATEFLMIPEYLMYKLCGTKVKEYTNATTTGMISTLTGEYSQMIIEKLGFPKRLFKTLRKPGEVIGTYSGLKCIVCATHDTASAVEGIPMKGNQPYISSGTWSLLGVKTDVPHTDIACECSNWSNEGGVGYIRFQKNITGMWLVNQLRSELCPEKPFEEIVSRAKNSKFDELVDVNSHAFLAPENMKATFDGMLSGKTSNLYDYFKCAYRSLAKAYMDSILELENITGKKYDTIYIVGGGAKNKYLNELTEQFTGKKVIALPIEASVMGNLKIQIEEFL